jgi:hypothetical protein
VSDGSGPWRRAGGSTPFVRLATAALVAIGLYALYFLVYRARGFRMPLGFDASWYVWRADFVADQGIGPLGTASRPGHALLSAALEGVTGRSQLELAVMLPLVLVSVFALATGAFWRTGIRDDGWCWFVPAALAGTVLGTTRLVGENVANLLTLALVVAALVPLMVWLARRRGSGLAGAAGLLVAAGLAHWLFLAVFGAVLALTFVLALPASIRDARAGIPAAKTESGALAAVVASAGAATLAIVAGVLHAPFSTFEIREDPARYLPKLRTDLSRLFLPVTAPLAAAGAALLGGEAATHLRVDRGPKRRAKGLALRILLAWTVVAAVGIAYGAITSNLPPHRFLALLVAVPLVMALAAVVAWPAGWAYRRFRGPEGDLRGAAATAAVAVIGVAALSIPGALAWYRHGPGVWLDPVAVQESQTASRYLDGLGSGSSVVFLISPYGPAGTISVPLEERTIRVGLEPGQQTSAYFFAGDPADAVAGRRTFVPNPKINRTIDPYWRAVRPVLASKPSILILKALAPRQFQEAVGEMGAQTIGPGVALVQGTPPPASLAADPVPPAVPGVRAGVLWGVALLALLGVAGVGWTRAMMGRDAPPEVLWCLSPAMGTGAVMLGALLAAKLGVELGGPGGTATYLVVAGLGFAAALVTGGPPRRFTARPARSP